MQFKLNRKQLESLISLIRPLVIQIDFKSISDVIYFKIENGLLTLRATGESTAVLIQNIKTDCKENIEFLTDAVRLLHVIESNTVETLVFNLTGNNIAEGEGLLTIKGNSVSKLPLKRVSTYCDFPDTFVDFQPLPENFISDFNSLSAFVASKVQNYAAGVCITPYIMIAANGQSGGFARGNTINTEAPFILLPEQIKPVSKLKDCQIAILGNYLLFTGTLDEASVYIQCSVMKDEYPWEQGLDSVKKWLKEEHYTLNIKKESVVSAIKRFRGFTSNVYDKIDFDVSPTEVVLNFNFQTYETSESLECQSSEPFKFSIKLPMLEDLLRLGEESLEIWILKRIPIAIIKNKKLLYFVSILKE